MTDDLRARIAKVLHERFGPSLGAHPDGWDREPDHSREMYLEDADAVIRQLDLATACGSGCMWQIPNRIEDMTPQQREALGLRYDFRHLEKAKDDD